MKPWTILHTIETGGPGGAETVLLNIASRLPAERFRSVVLLPRNGWLCASLHERGVPTILSEDYGRLGPIPSMVSLARRENAALIHAHLPDQNFYAALAGTVARRPVIATYHGDLQLTGPGAFRRKIKLATVRRLATSTVAVSDYLRSSLLKAGFSENTTVRIYNGIEPEKFRRAHPGRLRSELKCANGVRLVGMIANLRKSKNYDTFVRAARKVAEAQPEARFVAVGDIDPELGGKVRQQLRELSLEDKFVLLGFRRDVPELLADLDCFILSSESEGFSIATVEAMAAGRPVVVTRSGGPQEIVDHGRTGLLVQPGDPDALAAGITKVLSDRDQASALGRAAQAEVEHRFSVEAMLVQYQQLYERLLSSRESP